MSERLRCCVAAISVSEASDLVAAGRVGLHLSPAEQQEISGRHHRSLAGFLAAKEALCELFAEESRGRRYERHDFELRVGEGGAPEVIAMPAAMDAGVEPPERFPTISISHTKTWAYGMAARREGRS